MLCTAVERSVDGAACKLVAGAETQTGHYLPVANDCFRVANLLWFCPYPFQ